jgi:hypothetical protein
VRTHRIVRLATLAQCARDIVDLFDHLAEVLTHLVETVSQILRKLVRVLALLIRTAQLISRADLPGVELIDLFLVPVKPGLQLLLVALDLLKLTLNLVSGSLSLISVQEQLLDRVSVLYK